MEHLTFAVEVEHLTVEADCWSGTSDICCDCWSGTSDCWICLCCAKMGVCAKHTVCHDSGNIKDPIQTIGWYTLVMSRLFEWCTRLSYVLCLHCLHMNLTEVCVCVQYVNRLESCLMRARRCRRRCCSRCCARVLHRRRRWCPSVWAAGVWDLLAEFCIVVVVVDVVVVVASSTL